MREQGKNAYGIELSRAVLEKECPDMLSKGYVEPGILTNLPYEVGRCTSWNAVDP
jgi:hypothetical protein